MTRAFVRHASYLVQPIPDCGPEGIEGMHLVAKRSYRITPDAPCEPLMLQPPLVLADRYADPDDPLTSPLLHAGELSPPKPRVDVLLTGHCHPPGGEAPTCEVGLRVGDALDKRVLVIGDRRAWQPRGADRATISRPRPFGAMPLDWRRAYGGTARYGDLDVPHQHNPIGVGFWLAPGPGGEPHDHHGPMPNFEDPRRPLQVDELRVDPEHLDRARRPVGTGPIPLHWLPRARRGGLDPRVRAWMQATTDTEPTLPPLDPRVYNCAPDDQQLDALPPGALARLTHLHPEHAELRFPLPAATPALRFGHDRRPLAPVELRLDTVAIDADRMRLSLIWRGTHRFESGPRLADQISRLRLEVDGEAILPASLVDSGFPLRLLVD